MDDTGISREEILSKWEQGAKELLQDEKRKRALNKPEPVGVLVIWKDYTYIGSIQVIVPDLSKEIVVLSKSTIPLPVEFDNAIRKLDPVRLELTADDILDLTGRQHILRRVENMLTRMTPDQTEYMLLHPPVIHEI